MKEYEVEISELYNWNRKKIGPTVLELHLCNDNDNGH